ncbi:MAG: mannitol dehydrogenase family protein [Rhodobacteraceae bacterium]|nr:mannitol dehydrogenase family protein [Paracoccaceae bacterium]
MSRIVHLGPGAFFKAHLAAYTQEAGGWEITGLALRSPKARDEFQGTYTLLERSEAGTERREIDVLREVIHVPSAPAAAMAALTDRETKVVSLTVTEKAYAPGAMTHLLWEALAARRDAAVPPFTCLSCDNLPSNGRVLRQLLIDEAGEAGDWVAKAVSFPSTMVDRITPSRTEATVAEGGPNAEECEAFRQWVIEDDFPDGRPDWPAQFVTDVTPYEEMKIRMLNGAHSMLAYAGQVAGLETVRDVMNDEALASRVAVHMGAAVATLDPLPGTDFNAYARDLLARFRNPHLAHQTAQIAMDGSQKMPQRIFAPAVTALERGQDLAPFAYATAAWITYLQRTPEVADPRAAELRPATLEHILDLPDLLPSVLQSSASWRAAVTRELEQF